MVLSVIDEGQGIPESELNKLFIPFANLSVKSTSGEKSTGLGLAIVKKIIEGHKGTIKAKSKVGEGTTFIVELPIVEMQIPDAKVSALNRGTRVMIVEDNLMMIGLMKTIFEACNMDVMVAENGAEALELLKTTLPDIIFTDINMPVLDGYEFGEKLKEMNSRFPLLDFLH